MSAKMDGCTSLVKTILLSPRPIPYLGFSLGGPLCPGAPGEVFRQVIAPVISPVKRSKLRCKFWGSSYVLVMDGLTFLDPGTQEDLAGSDETGVLTEGKQEGRASSVSLRLYR